jgi:hypothetical protein
MMYGDTMMMLWSVLLWIVLLAIIFKAIFMYGLAYRHGPAPFLPAYEPAWKTVSDPGVHFLRCREKVRPGSKR